MQNLGRAVGVPELLGTPLLHLLASRCGQQSCMTHEHAGAVGPTGNGLHALLTMPHVPSTVLLVAGVTHHRSHMCDLEVVVLSWTQQQPPASLEQSVLHLGQGGA